MASISATFVKQYTTIEIYRFPILLCDKGPMMFMLNKFSGNSMGMDCNGEIDVGRGISNLLQVIQLQQKFN